MSDPAASATSLSAGSIDLRYRSFHEFLGQFSSRISAAGVLLPGKASGVSVQPGDVVALRLSLDDGFALIEGRAQVLWSQGLDVGLRFLLLTDESRGLLETIAKRHQDAGEAPFDLEAARPAAGPPEPEGPEPGELDAEELPVEDPGTEEPGPEEPDLEEPTEVGLSLPEAPTTMAPAPMAPTASRKLSWGLVLLVLVAGAAGGATYSLTESLVDWWVGSSTVTTGPMVVRDIPPPQALRPVTDIRRAGAEAAAPSESASEGPSEALAESIPDADAEAEALPPAQSLSRIRLVTSKRTADGTLVTLWGNGALEPTNLERARIEGEIPREVLKLRNIQWPLRDPVIRVGTEELLRIRSGLHDRPGGSELHLVLDLAAPAVQLSKIEQDGENLRLTLTR